MKSWEELDKPEGKVAFLGDGSPWFSVHLFFYFIIFHPTWVMSPQGLRQLLAVFMVAAPGGWWSCWGTSQKPVPHSVV